MSGLSSLYGVSPSLDATVEEPSIEERAKQLLHANVARLMSDSSFSSAAKALGRIRRDTFKHLPFVELLPLFACLAIMGKRSSSRRETWERLWATGTGKTWKALKDFPMRIRGIADEVDRVNSSPSFNPSFWITQETTEARIVRKRFTHSPAFCGSMPQALSS